MWYLGIYLIWSYRISEIFHISSMYVMSKTYFGNADGVYQEKCGSQPRGFVPIGTEFSG